MRKSLVSAILALLLVFATSFTAHATITKVDYAFGSIAAGSFTFDSAKEGSVVGYNDLQSFKLEFSGLTNSVYDLAFLNSGDFTLWYFFQYNTVTNSFLSQDLGGYYTTEAAIKNSFDEGFFVREDLKLVRDYVGGGDQYYNSFTLTESTVPEPSTLILLGAGLFGLAIRRKIKAGN